LGKEEGRKEITKVWEHEEGNKEEANLANNWLDSIRVIGPEHHEPSGNVKRQNDTFGNRGRGEGIKSPSHPFFHLSIYSTITSANSLNFCLNYVQGIPGAD
jgi:hypothetical protein